MLSIEAGSHLIEAAEIIGWTKIHEILLRLKELPGFFALKSLRIKLDDKLPLDQWQLIHGFCAWAESNDIKVCITYPDRYPCNMDEVHEVKTEWLKKQVGSSFDFCTWWTGNQLWIHPGSNNDFERAGRIIDEWSEIFPPEKYLHTVTYNCPRHWVERYPGNFLGMTIYLKTWEDTYQNMWSKYHEWKQAGHDIKLIESNIWLGEVIDGTVRWDFGEALWSKENIELAFMVISHASCMEKELVDHCFAHPSRWGFLFIDRKNKRVLYHPVLVRLIGEI